MPEPMLTKASRLLEFLLAVMVGVTLAVGMTPVGYVVYFHLLGWPHPYVTHTGPLWGTDYGDHLLQINQALLCLFPVLTLPLAIGTVKFRPTLLAYGGLALPGMQIVWGLLNYLPLALLLQ